MKHLVHRCSACGTFDEMTGAENIKAGMLLPLPVHYGLAAGIESGDDMLLAEHINQEHVCDGSEGSERVTEIEYCLECDAPIPADVFERQGKHPWHKKTCSMHAEKP
jgi:hypothetical protein